MSELHTEPTLAEVEAAVRSLPREHLVELAEGPNEDPNECLICELFDAWLYGWSPDAVWGKDEGGDSYIVKEGPNDNAILLLLDWHRYYASDGEGPLAYSRCLKVYELAREALA